MWFTKVLFSGRLAPIIIMGFLQYGVKFMYGSSQSQNSSHNALIWIQSKKYVIKCLLRGYRSNIGRTLLYCTFLKISLLVEFGVEVYIETLVPCTAWSLL